MRCTISRCVLVVVTSLLTLHSLVAKADVVTVPAGLNPGDQYRLVFVTSTTRDALSSNLADYNTFVTNSAQGVPQLAALGTTWSAIGSAGGVDARDNTGTNPSVSTGVPFYRLDGGLVALNNADLWDGELAGAINITELGTTAPVSAVWTGTEIDGTTLNPLGGPTATNGAPVIFPGYEWIKFFIPANSEEPGFVYGMSGVLTVVPEPGSVVLGAIGLIAVVGWHAGQRRRKRSASATI